MKTINNRAAPALCGHSACVYEKFIYIFGGHTGSGYSNDLYKFDMGTLKHSNFSATLASQKQTNKQTKSFSYTVSHSMFSSTNLDKIEAKRNSPITTLFSFCMFCWIEDVCLWWTNQSQWSN
jgi:hypothetical protein